MLIPLGVLLAVTVAKSSPAALPLVADVEITEEEREELAELEIPLPPPSYDRARYRTWKRTLSATATKRLARYCRANSHDARVACNGIGPLAIPVPPSRMIMPNRPAPANAQTWDQWHASLTPAQRRYVARNCRTEDEAFTTLCGATPLVLAFANERVTFSAAEGGVDWPTPVTPWLALDRDGDGAITSGEELFGSETPGARDGFSALAALDANHDGVIDARDPAFAQLLTWSDRDGDRRSSPDELTPVARTVTAISLAATVERRCDARLNCEGERAVMHWRGETGEPRTGAVIDVYLHRR